MSETLLNPHPRSLATAGALVCANLLVLCQRRAVLKPLLDGRGATAP